MVKIQVFRNKKIFLYQRRSHMSVSREHWLHLGSNCLTFYNNGRNSLEYPSPPFNHHQTNSVRATQASQIFADHCCVPQAGHYMNPKMVFQNGKRGRKGSENKKRTFIGLHLWQKKGFSFFKTNIPHIQHEPLECLLQHHVQSERHQL